MKNSLLVLMYHRAEAGPSGNSPQMLEAHFEHIARHYHCVLPGEPLDPARLNVCLSFDDGYRDCYEVAFPLLVRYGLGAVLGIPAASICDHSTRSYCSWAELREMSRCRRIAIAAHGYTHQSLDAANADFFTEVVIAKQELRARIGRPVESYVYPYGRISPQAQHRVQAHYRYSFRIGSADNADWNQRLMYRVKADAMLAPDALFSAARLAAYRMRRSWNMLRRR